MGCSNWAVQGMPAHMVGSAGGESGPLCHEHKDKTGERLSTKQVFSNLLGLVWELGQIIPWYRYPERAFSGHSIPQGAVPCPKHAVGKVTQRCCLARRRYREAPPGLACCGESARGKSGHPAPPRARGASKRRHNLACCLFLTGAPTWGKPRG
jgi:hypothetical protein